MTICVGVAFILGIGVGVGVGVGVASALELVSALMLVAAASAPAPITLWKSQIHPFAQSADNDNLAAKVINTIHSGFQWYTTAKCV